MKKHQKTLITIAICMVVLGTFLVVLGGIASAGELGRYVSRRWEERSDGNMDKYFETQENVESIDIDINYGEVKLVLGDQFSINASHVQNKGIDSYMQGNTWYIKDNSNYRGWSLFHWRARNWNEHTPRIEITIPKDFEADKATIVLGAGTLDVEQVIGKTVSMEVGAGKCVISSVVAKESLLAEVGAGELQLYKLDSQDTRMTCGAGRIFVEGSIVGTSNEIDCGIGQVDMKLTGNPDDYNYNVDCALGQVVINGDSYNISTSVNKNNNADYSFQINCGLGKVNLDMQERD